MTTYPMALQQSPETNGNARHRFSHHEIAREPLEWRVLATTGRAIGTAATEAGLATGTVFSKMAEGFVRAFGGTR